MTDSIPEDDPRGFVVNIEAVVYHDGDVLLATRADDEDHAAGERSLVGGKLERDADTSRPLAATVEREVREETGLEIANETYVCSSLFESDTGNPVVNVVFRARHIDGEAQIREPEETAVLDWVEPERALEGGDLPAYTADYLERADADRQRDGW